MPRKQQSVKFKRTKKKNPSPKTQELTRLGAALRTLGGLGGGLAGGLVGMGSTGQSLGTGLGATLSRWLGSGDYSVAQNSIVSSTKASTNIPMMHKTNQSIVVRHREFIGAVTGSVEYNKAYDFSLNPGLKSTFPWLSAIASNYQEYIFKGVVFHYVPTSGIYNPNSTALGSVMMVTTYRASDSSPENKYELLNEYWSNEVVPSDSLVHPIECKASETVLGARYIRDGAVKDDLMFYDYGVTTIATQGCADAQTIVGDLWVTYEVELRKPRMYASLGKAVPSVRFTNILTSSGYWFNNADLYFSSFLGTAYALDPDPNDHQFGWAAGNVGAYLVTIQIRGTSLANTGTLEGSITNGAFLNNLIEPSSYFTVATSTTRATITFGFKITDPTKAGKWELSGLTSTATGTFYVDLFVTAIDADADAVN